ERLLRLVLSMASLLERKNASIKRLNRLIFGPGTDARSDAGASAKEPAIFIQLTGQPLVGATRYEQEILRCWGLPGAIDRWRNRCSSSAAKRWRMRRYRCLCICVAWRRMAK
ncbi:MAG TPA: hypothetical protein PKD31_16295, partial [Blastocatellia bacterium]|nr:hypothetical protein [Blastocatellia bacterium]